MRNRAEAGVEMEVAVGIAVAEVSSRDATADCCCRRGAVPSWRVASLLIARARGVEAIASRQGGEGGVQLTAL